VKRYFSTLVGLLCILHVGCTVQLGPVDVLASNGTEPTTCQLEENVQVFFEGQASHIQLIAKNPHYTPNLSVQSIIDGITNQDSSGCEIKSIINGDLIDTVFDDDEDILEAVIIGDENYTHEMIITVDNAPVSFDSVSKLILYRRLVDEPGERVAVMVVESSGAIAVAPIPPFNLDVASVGARLILYPDSSDKGLPAGNVESCNYDSTSDGFLLTFANGASALLTLAAYSSAGTSVEVELSNSPDDTLCALVSKFVDKTHAETALLRWNSVNLKNGRARIDSFDTISAASYVFYRKEVPEYNLVAPDITLNFYTDVNME